MEDAMTSTTADSKQLVERYLQAISGQAKTPDLVARYVSDSHLAAHIQQVEAAFPGYELIVEQLIAEADLVAMRGMFRGVHRGEFAGIPATGRPVAAPLMISYRIVDGRIADHWLQFDGSAVVAQLSAPAAATA